MKKLLCLILVSIGIVCSFDAEARYGRVGGIRSSSFRSYNYGRTAARNRARNAIRSPKAKTVNTAKAKAISKAKTKNVTVNKTVVNHSEGGYVNHAPLWFLVGHSTAHDRVTVINNTNEKFSCSDCESVKDEVEVYKVCMEKCVK